MPVWNTKKIIADISKKIPDIKKITNQGQGGGVDTDNLYITFINAKGGFHVCGFNPGSEGDIDTPDNVEVEMVEITDGLDSRGGFNGIDENLALGYVRLKKYFLTKKFVVVNTLKDYY